MKVPGRAKVGGAHESIQKTLDLLHGWINKSHFQSSSPPILGVFGVLEITRKLILFIDHIKL